MSVNYRVEGNKQGQTLLLIHGGFDSLNGWDSWNSTLEKDFKMVSVDMPGHGLTDPLPDRNYTRYTMAGFIKDFVQELKLDDFIIIGHSMGGEYSLQYVINNPDKVKGIVILAAGGYVDKAASVETETDLLKIAKSPLGSIISRFGTKEAFKESFEEYMLIDADDEPEFFRRNYLMSRYEKNRDTSIKMISGMYKNPHNIIGLGKIDVPTLILWGDKDTIALPEHAYRFNKDIKDSTLIMYKEVAHGIQLEIGQKSAKDVVDFIITRDLNR